MKVIEPLAIDDAALVSSTVPENDYPAWSALVTYAKGNRAIVAASHQIFESAIDGNIGNAPASSAKWFAVSATNRWAMFDQAVGSLTSSTGSITVVLGSAGAPDAIAVLDTNAASVRVQVRSAGGATLFDETQEPDGGDVDAARLFLDLPWAAGARATVTISVDDGAAEVAAGTLILGNLADLGITEAGPQVGINDFSKRATDDFGTTTIVERAWAKRMTLRTLIDSATVDDVQRRLARLRAKPVLWIGEEGYDSLAIYGFYKDFSIDLALEMISYCTLTIEGLTTAGALDNAKSGLSIIFQNAATIPDTPARNSGLVPVGWTEAPEDVVIGEYRWWSQAQFRGGAQLSDWTAPVKVAGISWPDIIDDDPDHPKPEDGATVGAPTGTVVHNRSAEDVVGDLDLQAQNVSDQATIAGTYRMDTDEILYTADGVPIRTVVEGLASTVGGNTLFIQQLSEVDPESGVAKYVLSVGSGGQITGIEAIAGVGSSALNFVADQFQFVDPSGDNPIIVAQYDSVDGVWRFGSIEARFLKADTIEVKHFTSKSVFAGRIAVKLGTALNGGSGAWQTAVSYSLTLEADAKIVLGAQARQTYSSLSLPQAWNGQFLIDGTVVAGVGAGGSGFGSDSFSDGDLVLLGPGSHTIEYQWKSTSGNLHLAGLCMTLDAAIGGI